MNTKTFTLVALLTISALILASCNLPLASSDGGVNTAVALTVTANAMGEDQPQSTDTPQTAPSETPAPTATVQPPTATHTTVPSDTPEPTQTPLPCNRAEFVKDVTIPDGKDFLMGDTFTKTWRLKNTGSCTWTADYEIVFSSGDKMGAPDAVQLTSGTVETGETVDVSVDLTAPGSPGTFRGNWKLRDPDGVVFGIENSSSGHFWVEIEIDDPGPETVYDFHAKAPSATWITGAGVISFGGPDSDSDGFAMYKDGKKVEDGSTPSKVIEMHPEWVNNGVISGRFPSYTVQEGDHFRAKIGFLAFNDGSCGAGDAIFQFNYRNGATENIDQWSETCDGALRSIDIDLSSFAGESVKFIFAVTANGPATQDWAVWINPRIER